MAPQLVRLALFGASVVVLIYAQFAYIKRGCPSTIGWRILLFFCGWLVAALMVWAFLGEHGPREFLLGGLLGLVFGYESMKWLPSKMRIYIDAANGAKRRQDSQD